MKRSTKTYYFSSPLSHPLFFHRLVSSSAFLLPHMGYAYEILGPII
jgi:hypothetical protein